MYIVDLSFNEFEDDIFSGSDKIIRTPALPAPPNGIGTGKTLYRSMQKHHSVAQVILNVRYFPNRLFFLATVKLLKFGCLIVILFKSITINICKNMYSPFRVWK